jgi:hypothetical protein
MFKQIFGPKRLTTNTLGMIAHKMYEWQKPSAFLQCKKFKKWKIWKFWAIWYNVAHIK